MASQMNEPTNVRIGSSNGSEVSGLDDLVNRESEVRSDVNMVAEPPAAVGTPHATRGLGETRGSSGERAGSAERVNGFRETFRAGISPAPSERSQAVDPNEMMKMMYKMMDMMSKQMGMEKPISQVKSKTCTLDEKYFRRVEKIFL